MCFKRLVNIVGKRSFSSGIENKSIDLTVLKEGIAAMTMQQPPVNAHNIEMLEKMNTLLDEVSNDNCRGLVITSHGLIDDIAKDKQDAMNKCKEFIKKFDDIPPNARSMTKQRFRDAPMRKLRNNRQKDIDEFLNMIQNPIIQENVKKHVHGTK